MIDFALDDDFDIIINDDISTTQTIQTAIITAIYTDKGLNWANAKDGSELFKLKQKTLTSTVLIDLERYINNCLYFLISDGLATNIDVTINTVGGVHVEITITTKNKNKIYNRIKI